MDFQEVKNRIRQLEADYRQQGYTVDADYAEQAYRLQIEKGKLAVTIRDGYFSDGNINTKPVKLTSFEAFFSTNDQRFADYISDYPLEEYPDRLNELKYCIDLFFAGKYSISEERFLLFWKRTFLNIEGKDGVNHFILVEDR